jgi:SNF2 family DNA or RNA helicase
MCRHGRRKGVIVCPSSLVGNWARELQKWLPSTLGRSAIIVTSNGAQTGPRSSQSQIDLFVQSHASIHPVLVISYEMFRSYASSLNNIMNFEVLVCDEGHRLKNAYGTATTLALSNCCAVRRLVLTGTPVQNNLDELYAVVQFAVPEYLGSLQEFKKKYSDPIARGKAPDASKKIKQAGMEAVRALREKLSHILLRRTRDSILQKLLPPRTDFVIQCALSDAQREVYSKAVRDLIPDISLVGTSGGGRTSAQKSDQECAEAVSSSEASEGSREVLPLLMKLRQACNFTIPLNLAEERHLDFSRVRVLCTSLLRDSSKLRVLNALLTSIHQLKPTEKVVVVSNFTLALDAVELISRIHRWHSLRLDGSVPAEQRMKLVQHFNSAQSPFTLMLLSAKAGGVGLNLIGGNRLILVDCDWNPATDIQAMGRVWREGQTKPVFIYRLISRGTIEESILKRQAQKGTLSAVIKDSSSSDAIAVSEETRDNGVGGEDKESELSTVAASGVGPGSDLAEDLSKITFTREVLLELTLPRGMQILMSRGERASTGPITNDTTTREQSAADANTSAPVGIYIVDNQSTGCEDSKALDAALRGMSANVFTRDIYNIRKCT